MNDVRIQRAGLSLTTDGLSQNGQREITLELPDDRFMAEANSFLETMAAYAVRHRPLGPGETVEYGYWLIKLVETNAGTLEVWEYDADGTRFVKGARLALTYWRQQHEVCKSAGSEFAPPRPDKLAAVAAGVFEGDLVDAVRYVPEGNMSGWCFFTDRYDGNIKSLKYERLYHVTANRPDLAKYIALAPGFCFDLHDPQRIWFDNPAATRQ